MTRNWIWGAIPVALTILMIAVFVIYRPFDFVVGDVPPSEELTVERVTMDKAGFHVLVRAQGPAGITIAQVQVDGAYRAFTLNPAGPVAHLGSTKVHIAYPWIAGETHHLNFVTSTGTTFEHTIDVAMASPVTDSRTIWGLILIGLFIGLVPVSLGLGFYPVMRDFSPNLMQFILAFTVGLLAYLLVDTIGEGLELAAKAAEGFHANILMWAGFAASFLVLIGISRSDGKAPSGMALATFIAIGIGLHNMGEGLVVGASIASSKVSLATFLIMGFALHNLTEGIAISAPIAKQKKMTIGVLAGLAALAGLPAIGGILVGAYTFSPHWAALAFGVGAGAILQVIVEIGLYFYKSNPGFTNTALTTATWTGLIAGIGVMYLTAFLIQG